MSEPQDDTLVISRQIYEAMIQALSTTEVDSSPRTVNPTVEPLPDLLAVTEETRRYIYGENPFLALIRPDSWVGRYIPVPLKYKDPK